MEGIAENLKSRSYEDVIEALKNVHALLISGGNSIEQINSKIPVFSFIMLLQKISRTDDLNLLMSILEKILNPQKNPNFTKTIVSNEEVRKMLVQGIQHPSVRVRCFVINQISRFGGSFSRYMFNDFKEDFLQNIVFVGVKDKDLLVVKAVYKLFIEQLSKNEFLVKQVLFSKEFIEQFRKILISKSDSNQVTENPTTKQLRFFELYLSLAMCSSDHFKNCEWIINQFLEMLDHYCTKKKDDVLVLLNILELLKIIIYIPNNSVGLEETVKSYFEKNNVFGKIFEYYMKSFYKDDFLEGFFFSYIGQFKDLCVSMKISVDMFNRLFEVIGDEDADIKLVQISLEVIGVVCSRDKELMGRFLGHPENLENYFGFLVSDKEEVSSTAMHSISTIIRSSNLEEEMKKKFLFSSLKPGQVVTCLLEKLNSQYFKVDQRVPIFILIHSLSLVKFGVDELLSHPNFYSYMINRESENVIDGKSKSIELKYHIIMNLLKIMKKYRSEYDQKMMIEFMAYEKNGVYFNDNVDVKVGSKSQF